MLVTTEAKPAASVAQKASAIASELNAPYIPREQKTLAAMMRSANTVYAIVVGDAGIYRCNLDGGRHTFHPGMAMIRVKRLLSGEPDSMLTASGVRPGDRVIDCTMGMAADAIVFSHAVGDTGEVIALESEPIPYIFAREGLARYDCELEPIITAMRRIRVVPGDHLAWLCAQPDRSADIVYFDPMFRLPASGSSIQPLREMANSRPLMREAVEQAQRIARRTVVMKEHNRSGEFERLGFTPAYTARAKITYGVIYVGE